MMRDRSVRTATATLILALIALATLTTGAEAQSGAATQTGADVMQVPIELTVRDGRVTRRDMILVRVFNTTEVDAYSASALDGLLSNMLAEDVAAEIAARQWLSPDELRAMGFETTYNAASLSATMIVPPELQPVQQISARGTRTLPDAPRLEPASFSVALPFYATATAREREPGPEDVVGTPWSYGLQLMPSIGLGPVLAEGNLRYTFSESEAVLEEWEAALIRDIEDSVRITAGTTRTDTPGFLSGSSIFGLAIERRSDVGRESAFADRFTTSFEVRTESTAEIFVNDRLVRSLRLAPGSYELSDVPLTPGLNDVRVVITDSYGETRTIDGRIAHAPGLLPRGESAYAASAGMIGEELDIPLARTYFRYAMFDPLTADLYAEGTEEAQLAGAAALLALGPAGTLELGGAASRAGAQTPGDADYASRFAYRWSSTRYRWLPSLAARAEYRTASFTTPAAYALSGEPLGITPPWTFGASVQQMLPFGASLLVSGRYSIGRDELPDTATVSASLGQQIGRHLSLRAGVTLDPNDPQSSWRGEITLSTRMRDGNGSTSSTYHLRDEELDLRTAQRFGGRNRNASVSVAATRVDPRTGAVAAASGSARAQGPRGEAAVYAQAVPTAGRFEEAPQDLRLSARLAAGLYYADGLFGVGRPSRGSFALVSAERDLPSRRVLVNPGSDSAEAETGILGAAVLPSLPDYYEKPVETELPDVPIDYGLGATSHIIETGYRTGTGLRIEGDRLLYGQGRLVEPDGEPVDLQVLRITTPAGELVQSSFTDENGVFVLFDLHPGTYELRLGSSPGVARFELTGNEPLPFDLGAVYISRGVESML